MRGVRSANLYCASAFPSILYYYVDGQCSQWRYRAAFLLKVIGNEGTVHWNQQRRSRKAGVNELDDLCFLLYPIIA
jgi:hypothetical protein